MSSRRMAGAVGGALAAGLGLTAMMMLGERKEGEASELMVLERAAAARLGRPTPPADRLPDAREQALAQGAHLALSALAGVAYAAATPDETDVVPGGIAFGLAFYAAAHWIAGPALGLKAPEWRSDPATIGTHAANHVLFGLVTAAAAKAASRAG